MKETPDFGFTGGSDRIRVEVFRRNLSKRQKGIVWMIHIFSYSMNKKEAIIPYLQDFECCGIPRTKVKTELEEMERLNIIQWIREQNMFIIQDPDDWDAPINKYWNHKRFYELYKVNKRHSEMK
jgi:hypothetical protein